MNLEEFKKEVDSISLDKYGIAYTDENGKDCPILEDAFEDETAEEFVSGWAKKYDLDTLEEFTAKPKAFRNVPNSLK